MKKTVVLIQPPLLQQDMNVDIIQKQYWNVLSKSVERILSKNNLDKTLNESDGNFTGLIEPNIGLLYVAGALKRAGYEIKYIDLHLVDAESRNKYGRTINEDDIIGAIKTIPLEELNLVGISPLTVNYGWAIKISKIIKGIKRECKIFLGGVHASFEYTNILEQESSIDIISVGEGEESTVELADAVLGDRSSTKGIEAIKGLAYRNGNIIEYNGDREFIKDLDTLAYPLYEVLPKEYLQNFVIRVITSRGCSNRCAFCVPSAFFNRLRFRDYIKVVDEIEYYYNNYKCRTFMIGDLNFLSDYKYAEAFCQEIIRRKLDIIWMCQSRVNLIDKEITVLMKKAGCIMICLGIESADQEILDKSEKCISLDMCINACRVVKEAGINLFTFWVFGLPGETHDSAHKTIKLLRRMLDEKLIDYTHCTTCVPYPGTEMFAEPEKFGMKILTKDFNNYWLGCDYLGAGLPVVETKELSNYEIYAYWQLALAVVAGNLPRNW